MYKNELIKIGLTKTQAAIMDYLFEHGESKARDIARETGHPRGVVYKSAEELVSLGLAEKVEFKNEVARFRARHPRELEKILERREKEYRQNRKSFEDLLPNLISAYNLTENRPGVKFYEGEEGFRKILDDTLKGQTEILMLINTEFLQSEEPLFTRINEDYKKMRAREHVKKRVIRIGKKPISYASKSSLIEELTEIRYLEAPLPQTKASIQIYDGKISYQTINKGTLVAVLIEDPQIFALNKVWFEALWSVAI